MIGRLVTVLTRLACRIGHHYYLSTGCLHDQHDYCQNTRGQAGPKQPAACKFCAAPCICTCHRTT
ncbi:MULTISPECIES: hypothetical protein [Streptomyces]|uniref:Uncharacterized protein n=1 Tax=Streptomyces fradiae ATCC 10745 = DSM 40063 TaxID=1319510 RepID=A0A1Y2NPB0_STRFR|nr:MULTISPECIES: hypothetical protein [Streptomyces]OSY49071.1 hypothetical protein BG846_05310 [Streptomyces fradiae ATCC 10745 = DSM 40063]